jgi:hypothetical protein
MPLSPAGTRSLGEPLDGQDARRADLADEARRHEFGLDSLSVQVLAPEQAPPHPVKLDPASGAAVNRSKLARSGEESMGPGSNFALFPRFAAASTQ